MLPFVMPSRLKPATTLLTVLVTLTYSLGLSPTSTPPGRVMAMLANNVALPVMSAGFWQVTSGEASAVVPMARGVGFTHFDASCLAYKNEKQLGEQLAVLKRDSFFLTTKLDPDPRVFTEAAAYDLSLQQIDGCLASHGVTYFDLLLVHFPLGTCKANQEAWRAMEAVYAVGRALAIGVSNFCPSTLECIAATATITPHVNQVRFHVGMGPDPGGIKTYCEARGIQLQAYSPLGAGTTGSPRTPGLITGELVTSIGQKYGKTGAQVSLRWVVQHGAMVAVESTSEAHLSSDLGVFDWELSASDMATLDAANLFADNPPPYSFMCEK